MVEGGQSCLITGWPNPLLLCYGSQIVAGLPELKDCPKCGSGMKMAEYPSILTDALYVDKTLKPSSGGLLCYCYNCLNCGYLELYTDLSEETLRRKPPLTS